MRVKDIPAVLDQLDKWNKMGDHALAGRLDLSKVGMSGHSFGAVTTQAVSGQTTRWGKELFTDSRISAALIMSPSSPELGTPESAFGKVTLPWMLMTGTKDIAVIGNADMKSRWKFFLHCHQAENTSWCFLVPNIRLSQNELCRVIMSHETQITTALFCRLAPLSGMFISWGILRQGNGSMVTARNLF